MNLKVYPARAMSGLVAADVVREATADKAVMERQGMTVLCPVIGEKVKPTKAVIASSKRQMDTFWHRDKEMIREAHVVFDMSPTRKSEGVAHEIGLARYAYWKPVFRIYREGSLPPKSSIAVYEDDYICATLAEAIERAIKHHGTWWRRFKWRVSLYKRCRLKALFYEILFWFQ